MYRVCSSRATALDRPSQPLTVQKKLPQLQPHYYKVFLVLRKTQL